MNTEIINQPLSASQRNHATPETLSETYIVLSTFDRRLDYTQYNSDELVAEITEIAQKMAIESNGDFNKTIEDYVSDPGHTSRDYWFRKMHDLGDFEKKPQQAAAINRLKERYERELPSGTVLYRTSGLANDNEPELLDFAHDKSYRHGVVEFRPGTSTSLVSMSAFVTALPDEYARHLSTLKDRVRPARVRVRPVVSTSKHGSSSALEGVCICSDGSTK